MCLLPMGCTAACSCGMEVGGSTFFLAAKGLERAPCRANGPATVEGLALMEVFANVQQLVKAWPVP